MLYTTKHHANCERIKTLHTSKSSNCRPPVGGGQLAKVHFAFSTALAVCGSNVISVAAASMASRLPRIGWLSSIRKTMRTGEVCVERAVPRNGRSAEGLKASPNERKAMHASAARIFISRTWPPALWKVFLQNLFLISYTCDRFSKRRNFQSPLREKSARLEGTQGHEVLQDVGSERRCHS